MDWRALVPLPGKMPRPTPRRSYLSSVAHMAQVPREGAVDVRAKILHDVTRVRWLNHLEVSLHLDVQIQRAMIFIGGRASPSDGTSSPKRKMPSASSNSAAPCQKLRIHQLGPGVRAPWPSQHQGKQLGLPVSPALHPHYPAKPSIQFGGHATTRRRSAATEFSLPLVGQQLRTVRYPTEYLFWGVVWFPG